MTTKRPFFQAGRYVILKTRVVDDNGRSHPPGESVMVGRINGENHLLLHFGPLRGDPTQANCAEVERKDVMPAESDLR